MSPVTPRRGTGLAELIVVLALAAVVLAASTRSLAQYTRQRRARDAQAQAEGVAREVHEALRGALSHATDVRVLDDTAVDIASQSLLGRACDVTGARLVVTPSPEWWSPPRAGDSLAVIDTLSRAEWRTEIISTGSQRASTRCPAGGTRLNLATAPPVSVPVLVLPGRAWRRIRFAVYRASDGAWWLGERSCVQTCGSAQPVAGPVLPPAQRGVRLTPRLGTDGMLVALDIDVSAAVGPRVTQSSARVLVGARP